MKEILRRTWAEVDLDALAHNFQAVKAAAGEAKVCAVVKADAYGHGAPRLAQELAALGTDWFAVSNLEEALQLRRAGISQPILVLGFTPAEAAGTLAAQKITQCVYSTEYARALSAAAVEAGAPVTVHVKIDTGMSRLGFLYQDPDRDRAAVEEVRAACALPGLVPQGIFTHFAVADGGAEGQAFTLRQFQCFQDLSRRLAEQGLTFPLRHCANSAAIFDYPQARLDMVRAGIVLYGLPPSEDLAAPPDLRPALSLRSVVSHVKDAPAGATVSYGRDYTAEGPRRIVTVPVGYADGYPRRLSPGGASVLLHGRRCPIVGRVCMDQLMADATGLEGARIGDVVTLIGQDGGQAVTAEELARREGTIPYEVVCALSKRVPRVYRKAGAVVDVYDPL